MCIFSSLHAPFLAIRGPFPFPTLCTCSRNCRLAIRSFLPVKLKKPTKSAVICAPHCKGRKPPLFPRGNRIAARMPVPLNFLWGKPTVTKRYRIYGYTGNIAQFFTGMCQPDQRVCCRFLRRAVFFASGLHAPSLAIPGWQTCTSSRNSTFKNDYCFATTPASTLLVMIRYALYLAIPRSARLSPLFWAGLPALLAASRRERPFGMHVFSQFL